MTITAGPQAHSPAFPGDGARRRNRPREDTPGADPGLREEMLACVPPLRAFAVSLTGQPDRADDLVQETLLRALGNLGRFRPGTCLQAWLFTILRNLFHTEFRKRRREVEDPDGAMAGQLAVLPNQSGRLEFVELLTALAKLPAEQREALLLVTAQGFSYEEAAQITGSNLGTLKSRINRARSRLTELMGLDDPNDIGPDRLVRAVLYPSGRPL